MQVSRNVVSEPIRNPFRAEFMESEGYIREQRAKKRLAERRANREHKQWQQAAFREEQL